MLTRYGLSSVLIGLALATAVQAGTLKGEVVAIDGLESLSATVDSQVKTGVGKVAGIIAAIGGLGMLAAGRVGIGVGGLGAGIAMAFIPGIVSTAFDSTSAATFAAPATLVSQSAWSLSGLAYAALYPLFLMLRVLIDPVIVGCALVAEGVRRGTH